MLRLICDPEPRIREQGIRVCEVRPHVISSLEELTELSRTAVEDLSLSAGRIMECILAECGGTQYLRMIINHMSVDGVSWSIMLGDLSSVIA